MKRWIGAWIGLLALAAAGSAEAHKVYFNGVEVEAGLSGQSFNNVEVRFDEQGNVWITAKGYAIKVQGDKKKGVAPPAATAKPGPAPVKTAPAPAAAPAPVQSEALTKHYYVVALQSRVGATQYDIDVFVNAKWVKKVRSRDAHVVLDITPQVRVGPNTVHFAAVKNYDGQKRFSTSPTDTMSVVVGEGTMGSGTCMIDTPVAKIDVSAADTQSVAQDVSFTGR